MANILIILMLLDGKPTATRVVVYPTAEACAKALADVTSGKMDLSKGVPKGMDLGLSCNPPLFPKAGGKDA